MRRRSSPRSSSTVASVSGSAVRAAHELGAARVEDHRRAADQRRERLGDAVEAALGEHDPLEPLVRRERPLEHRVVLVDEVRGRLLGDRDERHLVGHLEQREAQLGGRLAQRLGHLLVREAGAEPEPGEPVAGQPLDVGALGLGVLEPPSRSSAAARRPTATASGPRALRCGPTARRSRARPPPPPGGRRDRGSGPRGGACASLSRRGAAARRPPRAPAAGRRASPRTAPGPRSAAARTGSPGRRGRRRGRSARG